MRTQVLFVLGLLLGAAAACLGAEAAPGRQPEAAAPPADASPADASPADASPADAAPGSAPGAPRSAPAPAEGPPLSQEGLARLAGATREQQQAWLRELKRRLDRALVLTLSAKRAAARQAEIDAALRRPSVDWDTLRSLVDELERREGLAIDTLERRCRVAIFNHFRFDTRQSDTRHETLDRVFNQWRRGVKTPANRDAMITWLEAALESCSSGSATPMPADPRLAPTAPPAPIEPPPASDATAPESSSERRPIGPLEKVLAGWEPLAARAEPTVDPTPLPVRRPGGAGVPPTGHVEPAPADESARATPAAASAATSAGAQSAAPASLPSESGGMDPVAPSEEPAGARSGRPGPSSARGADPGADLDVALGGALPRAEIEVPAPPWQPSSGAMEPPRAEVARERIDDVGELIGRAAAHGSARLEAEAAAGLAARTPPPANRPASLPTDVAVSADAPRHPATQPPVAPEPAPPPADVNLPDLAARIAGANLELRGLEAELIEERLWDVDRLERAVGRLEHLVGRLDDLARYPALVPSARRATIPAIESPRFAISRLGNRIHQARSHAAGTSFPGTPDQRREQLERLDALSRRLAELVVRDKPPGDSPETPTAR